MKHDIFRFFKKKFPSDIRWRFLGVLVIIWIIGIATYEATPYLIWGDVVAPINAEENFFLLGDASEWRGFLWYGAFWLLDSLGLSNGSQLTIYLDFFLFFSFLSMRWSIYRVFPHASHFTVFAFSLAYAVNIFTLYLVTSGKVFTPLSFAYATLPALIASYRMFLRTPTVGMGAISAFLFFLFSMVFYYPSALIATVIFFLFMTIFIAIFTESFLSWKKIMAVCSLAIAFLLVSLYAIPSALIRLEYGKDTFFPKVPQELESLHAQDASSLMEATRWIPFDFSFFMFPKHSAYPFMHSVGILCTIFPLIWIILGWLLQRREGHLPSRRFFWSVTTLFVFFSFFVSGFPGISEFFGKWIYKLPTLASLEQGSDFLLFLPALGIFIGVCAAMFFKKFTLGVSMSALLVSFSAFPFFVGGVYKEVTLTEKSGEEKTSSLSSEGSMFVEFPVEYENLKKYLRSNNEEGFIARLPYSPAQFESSTWENLSRYGYMGDDIFSIYFGRDTISPNGSYFGAWNWAKTFSQSNQDPSWIISLLGAGHIRYVMVHKDALPGSLSGDVLEKIAYLEKTARWKKIVEKDAFNVYKIHDKNVFPFIYTNNFSFSLLENPTSILALREEINQSNIRNVSYKKTLIGYDVFLEEGTSKQNVLTLSKPFDTLWAARLIHLDGEKEYLKPKQSTGFFQGWDISGAENVERIEIIYTPKKFIIESSLISAFSVFFVSMWVFFSWFYRNIWKKKIGKV